MRASVLFLLFDIELLVLAYQAIPRPAPDPEQLAPPVPVMVQRCAQARSHYLRLHHLPPAP